MARRRTDWYNNLFITIAQLLASLLYAYTSTLHAGIMQVIEAVPIFEHTCKACRIQLHFVCKARHSSRVCKDTLRYLEHAFDHWIKSLWKSCSSIWHNLPKCSSSNAKSLLMLELAASRVYIRMELGQYLGADTAASQIRMVAWQAVTNQGRFWHTC